MKIKLYVIDLEIPPRAKRWALGIGLPLAAILGGLSIAYAAVPKTWTANEPLKSADLNANFTDLDTRVSALETTIANQTLHLATCTNGAGFTTCVCPAGEIAISGGALPSSSGGQGFLVESRNIGPGTVPGTTWNIICKNESGVAGTCAV